MEQLIPIFIHVALTIELLRFKKKGLIFGHRIGARRLERFYYQIDVHPVLNDKQIMGSVMSQVAEILGQITHAIPFMVKGKQKHWRILLTKGNEDWAIDSNALNLIIDLDNMKFRKLELLKTCARYLLFH